MARQPKVYALYTAIALILQAREVCAQQAVPATTTDAHTLDAVTVTAQRREQLAKDVGIALSVIDGKKLLEKGVTKVNDLQNVTPSLEIEPAFGGGQPEFRLRGVGFQDYAANNAPTVGMYVNEVAYPVPAMTQGLLFDMQRVEVLRGPQGTLYGRNTTGGAVNFITNQPTQDTHAGVTIEYGRYNELRAEGYLSGALGSAVRGRLAMATEQGGGFQKNRVTGQELGDADRFGVRGLLDWDASDVLSFSFEGHYGRDKSEATGLYLFNDFNTHAGAGPVIPADTDHKLTGWGMSQAFADMIGYDTDSKPGVNNKSWGGSAKVSRFFDSVTASNLFAYDRLDRKQLGDWDASEYAESDTYFQSNVRVLSDEFKLSSSGDGPWNWVTGVYYSKQNQNEIYASDFVDVYSTYARVAYQQQVKSISGFGQVEYAATNRLKLIAGLRYEYEKRELQGFGTAYGGATRLAPTSVSTSMKPLTGKLGFQYNLSSDAMLYGSISKGVKSGGFTTYNTGSSSSIQPFKPETLWAYELGIKSEPTPTLTLDASAFYYDYRDAQVLDTVFNPVTNSVVGRFANAPKAYIYGAELDLTWSPTARLKISQDLGWKIGEYKKYESMDVAATRAAGEAIYEDRAGQKMAFPKLSYSGSVSYGWSMDRYEITAETNYSYHDTYPSWLGHTYDVDDYWLVNASISIAPRGSNWSLTFWGRNIFNQQYDLTRNFFVNADIAQPGRPATYGIRFKYDY